MKDNSRQIKILACTLLGAVIVLCFGLFAAGHVTQRHLADAGAAGSVRDLVVRDTDTGEEIARLSMPEGGTFSVGFVHSVNKSPVIDCYEIRDGAVILTKTIYYSFGAGVQTILEEGQSLSYGDDGAMIVTGFEQEMSPLSYIVGTVSDHVLTLGGYPSEEELLRWGNDAEEEDDGSTKHAVLAGNGDNGTVAISLRTLCGRNRAVTFSVED